MTQNRLWHMQYTLQKAPGCFFLPLAYVILHFPAKTWNEVKWMGAKAVQHCAKSEPICLLFAKKMGNRFRNLLKRVNIYGTTVYKAKNPQSLYNRNISAGRSSFWVMAAFCGFLSIWPHAALRRPVYGWQCFSIQVSFYCTGRVFGIIVMLKNRAAAKQMLSRCYCIQIWQFH